MHTEQTRRSLGEVFKTVGLPPYTYVKPKHFGEVRADIEQAGKHVLIEGPSGIGKTCVIYKVFEELGWTLDNHYSYTTGRDSDVEDVIDSFLAGAAAEFSLKPSILVVDDFHLLPSQKRSLIGSQLKRLSDRTFEISQPAKLVLIGIPTAGISLLSESYDLGPRLGTYRFSRATDIEIDKLIDEGEAALNVLFEDRAILLSESGGNFWLAQYICNKVCASQDIHETCADATILNFDLLSIRQRLMVELSSRYMKSAKIFARGKKWRPSGNKPYLEILLAMAKLPDLVMTYDRVLNVVAENRRPGLKAIKARIAEVIFDPSKGVDLRKQVAFEPDSGFSIEDPLFRYFLSNLNAQDLYRELGIDTQKVETSKVYSYDVGFSFAGESRRIVEAANTQLKAEDVVTFYDFDQQAVLLALDLEAFLTTIYSESCMFYLVFLDRFYKEKVWTKYEKDAMTRSGRRNHIVPVILDDEGAAGAVGIPSTIGHIDLRDVWQEMRGTANDDSGLLIAIRNRFVLPILDKLSDS